jgi:hypothetical protein
MEDKKATDMTLREYYLGIAMKIVGEPQSKLINGKGKIDYKGYVKQCNELVDNLMKYSK